MMHSSKLARIGITGCIVGALSAGPTLLGLSTTAHAATAPVPRVHPALISPSFGSHGKDDDDRCNEHLFACDFLVAPCPPVVKVVKVVQVVPVTKVVKVFVPVQVVKVVKVFVPVSATPPTSPPTTKVIVKVTVPNQAPPATPTPVTTPDPEDPMF
jgi:hypothetical protein